MDEVFNIFPDCFINFTTKLKMGRLNFIKDAKYAKSLVNLFFIFIQHMF
jgi:GDP-D-mannose dehydratase